MGFCWSIGLAADTKPAGLTWLEDYGQALDQAKATNRLLMFDFYSSWCRYCKVLDRVAFVDPRVVELSKEFVTAKLDGEMVKACAIRYRPEGFPTILFATPQGNEILRVSGYRTADQIFTVMKAVHDFGPKIAEQLAQAAKDRKDLTSRMELGSVFLELGLPEPALKYLEQAAKILPSSPQADPSGEEPTEARIPFMIGKAAHLNEDYKKATKTLQKVIDSHPGSPRLKDYYIALEESFTAGGKKAEAEKASAQRQTL